MTQLYSPKPSVQVVETQPATMPFALPDAASAAEDALDKALSFAARKMRLETDNAIIPQLLLGNAIAVQYASYGLACQIAETLGNLDETVQAVYHFEDCATPEDLAFAEPRRLSVNLIAHVTRKTMALDALVQALDRALAQRYGELAGSERFGHVLSVHPVLSTEIRDRAGYAALLTSLHYQPIRVWQR